jgi:hypothetical protein
MPFSVVTIPMEAPNIEAESSVSVQSRVPSKESKTVAVNAFVTGNIKNKVHSRRVFNVRGMKAPSSHIHRVQAAKRVSCRMVLELLRGHQPP